MYVQGASLKTVAALLVRLSNSPILAEWRDVDAALANGRITAATVRYIKLGKGGAWFDACLREGALRFEDVVPHEVAAAGDWNRAAAIYRDAGETGITDRLRELRAFYETGGDDLWITFGRGRLWWGFAAPGVTLSLDGGRTRQLIGGWSDIDAAGQILSIASLSTSLTQTAAYQRTICTVGAAPYLLRRLNAEPDALALNTRAHLADLTNAVGEMIADLHWRDFEVLVDLMLSYGGWRRIAAVGGSGQADSDLILEQPITGERAFVQIKSKATPATLRHYVEKFDTYPGMDRFIFACHTPSARLSPPDDPRLALWLRPELAGRVVSAGLTDWLLARRT